jgi:hypothetical protein
MIAIRNATAGIIEVIVIVPLFLLAMLATLVMPHPRGCAMNWVLPTVVVFGLIWPIACLIMLTAWLRNEHSEFGGWEHAAWETADSPYC